MRRTNIYLDERQTDLLDRLAAEEGTSRADLVRLAIDRFLEGRDDDVAADLAAIDGSFGALADVAVPERGLDERAAHLDRMWSLDG